MLRIALSLIFSLSFNISVFANAQLEGVETNTQEIQDDKRSVVKFTLRNSSSSSIPLIIPSVMKPNLSPNSDSGVSLKMGQEVYFRVRGKKYTLLTVDRSIKNGDVVEVSSLIAKRKSELGLAQ